MRPVLAAAAVVVGVSTVQLTAGATVFESADRLERRQVSNTLPPPSAKEICGSMSYRAYEHHAQSPAAICYRAVAAEQGWSTEKIQAWQPFLITEFSGVIQGESSSCWNLRNGDRITAGELCTAVRRTTSPGSDTGWGQVTSIWYGPGDYLCERGYCGWRSIIASPYDSMLASVILPVEMGRPYGGSDPWCFSAWARSYHRCAETPPDR